jgi:hypothetical protein
LEIPAAPPAALPPILKRLLEVVTIWFLWFCFFHSLLIHDSPL